MNKKIADIEQYLMWEAQDDPKGPFGYITKDNVRAVAEQVAGKVTGSINAATVRAGHAEFDQQVREAEQAKEAAPKVEQPLTSEQISKMTPAEMLEFSNAQLAKKLGHLTEKADLSATPKKPMSPEVAKMSPAQKLALANDLAHQKLGWSKPKP